MLSPPFQLHEKNDSGAHDTGEDDDEPTGTLKDAEWPIIGNMSSQEHERTEQDDSGGDSEAGNGQAVESKDEDPEATRRYWEVKWKKEGIWKVYLPCCYVVSSIEYLHMALKAMYLNNTQCSLKCCIFTSYHYVHVV